MSYKRLSRVIMCIMIAFIMCPKEIHANHDISQDYEVNNNSTFDLTNPKEQKVIKYGADGEQYTIRMLPALTRDYIPLGSFSRTFEASGFSTTMSAVVSGSTNPYVSQINSVKNGLFKATFLTWLKDTYSITRKSTTSNDNPAKGSYTATFTSYIGNTATRTLHFDLYLNGYIDVYVTYG